MTTIAVIGLGYVGLSLAVEFGRHYRTIGIDLSAEKTENIKKYHDAIGEVPAEQFRAAPHLVVTANPSGIAEADFT